jgi:N-acetylneuraminate synthase
VKFQTFKAEQLVSPDTPKAIYQMRGSGSSESHYDMLKRLELSQKAHQDLRSYCRKKGILFMSTPFDQQSADFLSEIGVPVFKIASGEITNLPFLRYVARMGKPMIVSTGMAHLSEVEEAIHEIFAAGNQKLVLLHCVSNYPAEPADVNLRAMNTLAKAFNLPVGFSDHTLGIEVSLAAVALGASVIEKHFTLNRDLPGPDHRASLEPDDLAALVQGIRKVESSLGHGRKEPADSEVNTALVARKSLVAAKDIPANTVLTEELITIKRPGTGLPPIMLSNLVGRILRQSVKAGTLFDLEMLT